jgi:hypothetical protein
MSVNENLDYLYEKICSLERGLINLGLRKCDKCSEYRKDVETSSDLINLCFHCRHEDKLNGEV